MEIVHRNIKLQTIKLWNHNILWSNACQEHTHGGSHTSSIGAKKDKGTMYAAGIVSTML